MQWYLRHLGLVVLVICFPFSAFAVYETTGVIETDPLVQKSVDAAKMKNNVQRLLAGACQQQLGSGSKCDTSKIEPLIMKNAAAFHEQINQALGQSHKIDYKVTYQSRGNREMYDIEFPSLLQRPGGHPANTVHAQYIVPFAFQACWVKLPTVILIHHSLDDIEQIRNLAENLVSFGNQMGVLIFYLPHFGPRRAKASVLSIEARTHEINSDFLDLDHPEEIQKNIVQSLLDIYTLKQWLIHVMPKRVDQQRISLFGLSLGGMIAPLYAGMDSQGFQGGYGALVGGGDFAGILKRAISRSERDQFTEKFAHISWQDLTPYALFSHVDPVVWAGETHDTRMLLINSKDDEIMHPQYSVQNYASSLGTNVDLELDWTTGKHNLSELGLLDLFFNVFRPIMIFAMDNAPKPLLPRYCTFN